MVGLFLILRFISFLFSSNLALNSSSFYLFLYYFIKIEMFSAATSAFLLALASSAAAQSSVAQLVGQLRLAPTQVDRLNL